LCSRDEIIHRHPFSAAIFDARRMNGRCRTSQAVRAGLKQQATVLSMSTDVAEIFEWP
jgi:hypothetical protein